MKGVAVRLFSKNSSAQRGEILVVSLLALGLLMVILIGNLLTSTPGTSEVKQAKEQLQLYAKTQDKIYEQQGKYTRSLQELRKANSRLKPDSDIKQCKYRETCLRWEIRAGAVTPSGYSMQMRFYTPRGLTFYNVSKVDGVTRQGCLQMSRRPDESLGCMNDGSWK